MSDTICHDHPNSRVRYTPEQEEDMARRPLKEQVEAVVAMPLVTLEVDIGC